MRRVLVLNTDYRPIAVTTVSRGMSLLQEPAKAHVLETSNLTLSSEKSQFDVPSVIALHSFRKVPHDFDFTSRPPSRMDILTRDNHKCLYCGAPATTLDHVVPISKGGGRTWENLASACLHCNGKKGNRMLAQSGLKLRRSLGPPKSLPMWTSLKIYHAHRSMAQSWSKYLQLQA